VAADITWISSFAHCRDAADRGTLPGLGRCDYAMPGCRKLDTESSTSHPRSRIELRRYVRRGAKAPRASNDNRRPGGVPSWYWVLVAGAMPTLGLLAMLSTLI